MARKSNSGSGNTSDGTSGDTGGPVGTDGTIGNDGGGSIGGIPVERIDGGTGDFGNSSGTTPGPGKRGRGRPPGGGTPRTDTARPKIALETLQGVLLSVHEIAAALLKVPELEVDEQEALKLAKAIIHLQSFYPAVDVPAKVMAWAGVAIAAGQVYAPRIGAISIRTKRERANKPGPVPVPAFAGH